MSASARDTTNSDQLERASEPVIKHRPATRVLTVGISESGPCGVRDHAQLLSSALESQELACSIEWLSRPERSPHRAYWEVRSWTRKLVRDIELLQPAAILLAYSAFSYSYRGVPIFAHPVVAGLRRAGLPVIGVLHELAYAWRRNGWRGAVWATTQREALIEVVRASTAVVVTTEQRADWLASRRWLPARPVRVCPVFSNLPKATSARPALPHPAAIGLFGYGYEGSAISLVLDALCQLANDRARICLKLLGAPGPESAAAAAWRLEARQRGIERVLDFSGILPAQMLADALAACDILLFADQAGPSSRKGTLAASLASGTPVIAIDGPDRWQQLVASGSLCVVPPASRALAAAIGQLLADEDARLALGARGAAFSGREMSVASTAESVADLIRSIGF